MSEIQSSAPRGLRYREVRAGATWRRRVAITEAMIREGADLIGDHNPLHVDADFAGASRHGGVILHGVITSALMGAELGMVFAGTAIGYLEHDARFVSAVRPGDVLDIVWTVSALHDKPKHDGGIVEACAEARNQRGELVAVARGKMLVANAPVSPAVSGGAASSAPAAPVPPTR